MKDTKPAEQWQYERVARHIPLRGRDFTLQASGWRFGYSAGLWARLRFVPSTTAKPYTVPAVKLVIGEAFGSMSASDLDLMIDAWAERLSGMTLKQVRAASVEELSVFRAQTPAEVEKAWERWKREHDPDPAARLARQQEVLAAVNQRFPAFARHVKAVWGLPVPRTLAVLQAFFESARGMAEEVILGAELQPAGVLDRLAPGGLARKVTKKRDERCHGRYFRDPPEFLPIAFGGEDRLHYGLWYDVDNKLPPEVWANHASDTAECFRAGTGPIAALVDRVNGMTTVPGMGSFRNRYLKEILAWFAKAERAVKKREAKSYAKLSRNPPLPGGPGVVCKGARPPYVNASELDAALRSDKAEVNRWIVEARKRLAAGDARLALELGRAMHWMAGPTWPAKGKALLLAAYDELGRTALAGIARAHYAQRDARSVDTLEPEPEPEPEPDEPD